MSLFNQIVNRIPTATFNLRPFQDPSFGVPAVPADKPTGMGGGKSPLDGMMHHMGIGNHGIKDAAGGIPGAGGGAPPAAGGIPGAPAAGAPVPSGLMGSIMNAFNAGAGGGMDIAKLMAMLG